MADRPASDSGSESDAAARTAAKASTSAGDEPDEYAKAAIESEEDFLQALDRVKGKPLRVRQIQVKGLERTKAYIVERELDRLNDATTLEEISEKLSEAWSALESLEIFTAVELVVDESGNGRPDHCDVIVNLAEKNRLHLHTGTYVQGTEGSLEFTAGLTNALGLAENIQVSAQFGHQSSSEYAIVLAKPRIYGLPLNAEITLHQQWRSYQKWSSFKEQLRGGIFSLLSEDGRHALSYELGWRHLSDPTRLASKAVREQLGHSLKSALRYVWRHNTFDDTIFPTTGFGIRSSSEVAGLWPDPKALRFGKQEVRGEWVTPLSDQAVFAVQFGAGVLLPWGRGFWDKPTHISERFSLGGVSGDLRSFNFRGVGPTDLRARPNRLEKDGNEDDPPAVPERTRDYLGGDLYCALLAAIRFRLPVPAMDALGIYGHVFVNGGNNILLAGQQKAPKDALRNFADTFRWSAGVGLVYPTQVGNLEVDFCRVLRSQTHDSWRHGIHVGFAPRGW